MIHISICKNCDHFKYNGPNNETHIPHVGCTEENCRCREYKERELLELEEGEMVLSKEERKRLAEELSTHYVSYNKLELRELVKKICRIL